MHTGVCDVIPQEAQRPALHSNNSQVWDPWEAGARKTFQTGHLVVIPRVICVQTYSCVICSTRNMSVKI